MSKRWGSDELKGSLKLSIKKMEREIQNDMT